RSGFPERASLNMAPLTGIALASNWLINKLNLNSSSVKTTIMTTTCCWLHKSGMGTSTAWDDHSSDGCNISRHKLSYSAMSPVMIDSMLNAIGYTLLTMLVSGLV
ncbi:hypothetical protein, partial [Erwinia sp. S59]|uniref:hypothetical protein n=1 Tax=Erwinia sp. S59 TaxID=2769340 RepID=UPI0025723C2F